MSNTYGDKALAIRYGDVSGGGGDESLRNICRTLFDSRARVGVLRVVGSGSLFRRGRR